MEKPVGGRGACGRDIFVFECCFFFFGGGGGMKSPLYCRPRGFHNVDIRGRQSCAVPKGRSN